MSPVRAPGYIDITHNYDEAAARNQNPKDVPPHFVEFRKEAVVVGHSPELCLMVRVLLQRPVRRRCQGEMNGRVGYLRQIAGIALPEVMVSGIPTQSRLDRASSRWVFGDRWDCTLLVGPSRDQQMGRHDGFQITRVIEKISGRSVDHGHSIRKSRSHQEYPMELSGVEAMPPIAVDGLPETPLCRFAGRCWTNMEVHGKLYPWTKMRIPAGTMFS